MGLGDDLGEWPDARDGLGYSSVAFTLETDGHLVPKRGESIAAAFNSYSQSAARSGSA